VGTKGLKWREKTKKAKRGMRRNPTGKKGKTNVVKKAG